MTLKEAREKRGLTQREVAQRVGIAENAYQQYEYGKIIPNAVTACAIAQIFNVTVEALYAPSKPSIVQGE